MRITGLSAVDEAVACERTSAGDRPVFRLIRAHDFRGVHGLGESGRQRLAVRREPSETRRPTRVRAERELGLRGVVRCAPQADRQGEPREKDHRDCKGNPVPADRLSDSHSGARPEPAAATGVRWSVAVPAPPFTLSGSNSLVSLIR